MSDSDDTNDDIAVDRLDQSYFVSKIKPMLRFILACSCIIGIAAFIGYDIHSDREFRREQLVVFIEKMRSEGWEYSCVGGGKMIFTKKDELRPFMVRENCRGLK